jgi:CRISPR-associated endonuclease/helicase Cas3
MREYYSHPGKLLSQHLANVAAGTRKRTSSRSAEIAALFHDVGKINPNFQLKLNGRTGLGYSSHAYLSAFAWLSYCDANFKGLPELLGCGPGEDPRPRVYSIAMMIARHHGNLPNLKRDGFFNATESERMREFLKKGSAEDLPFSQFLQPLLNHNSFEAKLPQAYMEELVCRFHRQFGLVLPGIADPLAFYMDTLFGFAGLIESDKRDAGSNTIFNKRELGGAIIRSFPNSLDSFIKSLPRRAQSKQTEFDSLRTEMRSHVIEQIRPRLADGERVFLLSAPTGAGKTLMLLSLAAEILKHDNGLSLIYSLPFLSITEQTESICKSMFQAEEHGVLRIDSKSENERIDAIQRRLDSDPSKANLSLLMKEIFSEATFDHPFIITTFVQFFEALVSNRNSTLIRLPNFANSIFLIDEIQALPPRLYTFFTAYLDEFCRRFNSYAIISTATMPYVEFPDKDVDDIEDPRKLFKRYKRPPELLGPDYFKREEFNRYRITRLESENLTVEALATIIRDQDSSCLVILNTIGDTKLLYEQLAGSESADSELASEEGVCILINTHFTAHDRSRKIALCKQRLKNGERVILISTQLVEAGVDIDFPVVFRDMCPLPSLIQAAGRCNRNGELEFGEVFLFELKKANGRASADYIYRRDVEWFLDETKNRIKGRLTEMEVHSMQREFFEKVGRDLQIGLHRSSKGEFNMVRCINEMAFEDIGRFRLIDDDKGGVESRYYVHDDEEFDELSVRVEAVDYREKDFERMTRLKSRVDEQLRRMAANVVTIRVPEARRDTLPLAKAEAAGILWLDDPKDYSPILGMQFSGSRGCII